MAIGTVLILLAISNYITFRVTKNIVTKDTIASLVIDSTEVIIDTVYVASEVVKYEWLIVNEAEVDTTEDTIIYTTQIDTSIIIDKDTVVTLKQDISFSQGIFEILSNITIKPIEKIITVNRTEFRTVLKEVPAEPIWYNTWIAGFISGVVAFLILALSL